MHKFCFYHVGTLKFFGAETYPVSRLTLHSLYCMQIVSCFLMVVLFLL